MLQLMKLLPRRSSRDRSAASSMQSRKVTLPLASAASIASRPGNWVNVCIDLCWKSGCQRREQFFKFPDCADGTQYHVREPAHRQRHNDCGSLPEFTPAQSVQDSTRNWWRFDERRGCCSHDEQGTSCVSTWTKKKVR